MAGGDSGRVLLSVALGIVLAVLLPWRFTPLLLVIAPLLPLLALKDPRALLGWLAAGVIYALIWQAWAQSLRPDPAADGPAVVVGRVATLPQTQAHRQRFILAPRRIDDSTRGLPRRIRVSLYGDDLRVAAGEHWRLRLRLRRPRGFMNPLRFDYERWLASEHIDATGYVVDPATARRLAPASGLVHWRSQLAERIGELSDTDGPGRALLQGLVAGDRRAFSERIWTLLKATGTSHLMAISGLHIGLVAGFGYTLAGALWAGLRLPGRRRISATLGALAAAMGYAALAGFALPTTRALIMFSVVAAAALAGRRVAPLRVVSIAALLVLLVDPAAALGAGFWLSFSAVAVIIVVIRGRRLGAIRGLWQIQLGLLLGLAPLSGVFFGGWSPLGLLVNLLVLPLFSLVLVPAALLGGLLGVIAPALGERILQPLAQLLNALVEAAGVLHGAGLGELAINAIGPLSVLFLGVGLALLLTPAGTPLKSLALPLAAGFVLAAPGAREPGSVAVTWLEVGQGSSAVIRTAGRVIVVDTGPAWSSGSNAAAFTLLPFLADRGIEAVDRLIVTHADRDHRGGVEALADAVAIGRIDAGEPLAGVGRAARCHAGMAWQVGAIDFEYLWPPRGADQRGNAASCVLLMSAPGGRVLFTGDIDRDIEARIAGALSAPVDVIEAAHHGSRSSTGGALLAAAAPAHAVVSAGYRNAYGMPHAAVIERLRCHGSRVHDLGLGGALELRIHPETGIELEQRRPQVARLLHERPGRGRFRQGREIHYDRAIVARPAGGKDQPTCGN